MNVSRRDSPQQLRGLRDALLLERGCSCLSFQRWFVSLVLAQPKKRKEKEKGVEESSWRREDMKTSYICT